MGYMRIGRVYEPIYTVNNLYNDLIILKIFFLPENYVFFTFFKWNFVLFTSYSNIHKSPVWSPAIIQNAKKARALTSSTFGIYS